jgi:hypothetical protein
MSVYACISASCAACASVECIAQALFHAEPCLAHAEKLCLHERAVYALQT